MPKIGSRSPGLAHSAACPPTATVQMSASLDSLLETNVRQHIRDSDSLHVTLEGRAFVTRNASNQRDDGVDDDGEEDKRPDRVFAVVSNSNGQGTEGWYVSCQYRLLQSRITSYPAF